MFLVVFHFIIYCIVKSSLNWNRIRVTNKQDGKRRKKHTTQTHALPPIRRVPGSASAPVPYGLNGNQTRIPDNQNLSGAE